VAFLACHKDPPRILVSQGQPLGGHSWSPNLWFSLVVVAVLALFGPDYALTAGAKLGLPTIMKVALHCGACPNKRDVAFSATVSRPSCSRGMVSQTKRRS